MHLIKINNTDTPYYYCVVDERSHSYTISKYVDDTTELIFRVGFQPCMKYLPNVPSYKDYQIIGTISNNKIDEQVKVLVEFEDEITPLMQMRFYKNYVSGKMVFTNWKLAARSLLTHNGIEIKEGEKLSIIKKV